jgi:hypothetical protein
MSDRLLRPCDTCGTTPCAGVSFCRACRKADRDQAAAQSRDTNQLAANWDGMSAGALWEVLNNPRRHRTPQSLVDAIMVAVKARGVAALDEPANVAQLECCDADAKALLNKSIEALRQTGMIP